MRTASSSVKSPRSRTQWPSRCVWIEQSEIWLTWAPASEKVGTVRGCFIATLTAVGVERGERLHEELLEVGLEREVDDQLDRVDAARSRRIGDGGVRRQRAVEHPHALEVGLAGLGADGAAVRAVVRRPDEPLAYRRISERLPLLLQRQRPNRCPFGQRVERQPAAERRHRPDAARMGEPEHPATGRGRGVEHFQRPAA